MRALVLRSYIQAQKIHSMKNVLYFNLLILVSVFSCKPDSEKSTSTLEFAAADNSGSTTGLCIWKEISVKDTPSEKGKFLTSVLLGEKFEVLQDTASENVNGKVYKYQNIKLVDGTVGWIRKEFIAVNAIPAVFTKTAVVYKRPDLMASSKKTFAALDFVAVKDLKNSDWVEVIGKRNGDTWFTSGWVKNEHLTRSEKDVMFAVLYARAMETADATARENELNNLLSNADLQGSMFYATVSESLQPSAETISPDSTANY